MLAFIKNALKTAELETPTVQNSENINSKKMIRVAISIMFAYGLISTEETKSILTWMKSGSDNRDDSVTAIVNDFIAVLNELIATGIFKITTQKGFPYYILQSKTIVYDGLWLNFEPELWDYILMRMRTCKKKYKVIHALEICMKMHHRKKEFKRFIDVDIAPGCKQSINVYSVSVTLLNHNNLERLIEMEKPNYLIDVTAMPIGFHPVVVTGTKIAGMLKSSNTDENFHQYVCGISRSGKTKYLCEQAIVAAKNDEPCVITDHSGAFSEHELKKHLPATLVDRYFSFWSIPKQGLPADITKTDNYESMTEKKHYLKSIYAAVARNLSDKQDKVLLKCVGEMLKYKNGIEHISDILDHLDEKDDVQKAIRDKLEGVLNDLKDLPKSNRTWTEFLASKKKIVVIEAGNDSVSKSVHIVDMILSSFYYWKQCTPDKHMTFIMDECQDLYLEKDGPVDIMIRKGAKHGISLILASQEFSAAKDRLGKIIGNCGTFVFFRPKADNLTEISKITGVAAETLASLRLGQCVVYGLLYDKEDGRNKQDTIIGWTYKNPELKTSDRPCSVLRKPKFK